MPVEDGRAAVGGDAETGLDLAKVGPAVLGMAEAGLGEVLLGHPYAPNKLMEVMSQCDDRPGLCGGESRSSCT